MKHCFTLLLVLISFSPAFAQESKDLEASENRISVVPESQDSVKTETPISVAKEPYPLNMDEIKRLIGYPQIARDKGLEGSVILKVWVGEKGEYIKSECISEVAPILVKSCQEHVSKLKFSPAIDSLGNPVAFAVDIPFNFRLLNGPVGPTIENMTQSGYYAFEGKSYERALRSFLWVIRKDKKNLPVYLMLGSSRFYLNEPWTNSDFQRALKLTNKLAKKDVNWFEKRKEELEKPIMVIKEIRSQSKDADLNITLDELIKTLQ